MHVGQLLLVVLSRNNPDIYLWLWWATQLALCFYVHGSAGYIKLVCFLGWVVAYVLILTPLLLFLQGDRLPYLKILNDKFHFFIKWSNMSWRNIFTLTMLFPLVKSYSHCCVHLNCLARCRIWEESQENRWCLQIINENFNTVFLGFPQTRSNWWLWVFSSGLWFMANFKSSLFCSLWVVWKLCPSYLVLVNSRSSYSKHCTGKLSSLSVQRKEELFNRAEYFPDVLGGLVSKFGYKYLVAVTIEYVV